jgi:hypothetical protein
MSEIAGTPRGEVVAGVSCHITLETAEASIWRLRRPPSPQAVAQRGGEATVYIRCNKRRLVKNA